jgi:hypothetical protein
MMLTTLVGSRLSGSIAISGDSSLADSGVLPPIMREWSHDVRELGNDAAHPVPGSTGTTPKDAKDVVRFLDYCSASSTAFRTRLNSIGNARRAAGK